LQGGQSGGGEGDGDRAAVLGVDDVGCRPRRRITVEPLYTCGNCVPCRNGRYNLCTTIGFHGLSIDGGMAEYTVINESMAHKLPDEVSTELGALVEPMSVAYHAAKLGTVDPDGTALVFGAGPIGIGLWFALRGQGVEDVLVVEPSPVRRASIEHLGARTLDPTEVDVPAFVADHTKGSRGRRRVRRGRGPPRGGGRARVTGPGEDHGQRRDLRATTGNPTDPTRPARGPDPGHHLLHRRRLPRGDRPDGARALRHHRVGREDRDERHHHRGFEALHAGRKMKVLVDPNL
jgi:Alcohol dehydrogenase GroES-like domain